jgi:hypothetical protein
LIGPSCPAVGVTTSIALGWLFTMLLAFVLRLCTAHKQK